MAPSTYEAESAHNLNLNTLAVAKCDSRQVRVPGEE